MNVTPPPRPSSRLGQHVLVLLLAWIIVAGLSWAEPLGLQNEPRGGPVDVQLATELDVDELRDEATTKALIEAAGPASPSLQASANHSSVPCRAGDTPLPTSDLLSELSVYRL